MRIGLISDVHANLVALEAVLDDMPAVDEIVCAGDVVGYNPWPAECVEKIREVASVCVQGNHDRSVEDPLRYGGMAREGLRHARAELTDEQLDWLVTQPRRAEFADGAYQVAHSHPDPDEMGTYVFPDDFTDMEPYVDGYDGLVLGHTHVQHKAVIDDRLVVNPGSVGQPRDKNPDAAYAILNTETQTVDLHRVRYDIDRVISKVELLDLPTKVGTRLLDGS